MKVKIPLTIDLIDMQTDMGDACNPESLFLMPIRECSRCATLRKRYENALLEEMQAKNTHEIPARLGDVGTTKAVNDSFRELVNRREALLQHILLNHPEIAGATLVG